MAPIPPEQRVIPKFEDLLAVEIDHRPSTSPFALKLTIRDTPEPS
jgi:hypothetical protein